MWIIVAVLLAVACIAAALLFICYYPVPQGHVVLIERFGQYQRTISSGINFLVPVIDKPRTFSDWGNVANKLGVYMELSEQHTDTPSRQAMTKDNVEVEVDASIYWQIIDPMRARYEVDRLPAAITDMALNVLRTGVGSITLDQTLTERARLNQYLLAALTKAVDKWGTKVVRVEIQTIRASAGGAGEALIKEMSAERERRALILKATGEKEATILHATAEKEASVLRAQGDAASLLLRCEAEIERLRRIQEVAGPDAIKIALAWKYMETLSVMAKDPALKVFLDSSTPMRNMMADFATHSPRHKDDGYDLADVDIRN